IGFQGRNFLHFGQAEVHTHEETSGFHVAELLGIDDVALQTQQPAGHGMHDAGLVGTGEGEYVFLLSLVVLASMAALTALGGGYPSAARTSRPMARLAVRPGDSMPNRFTSPGTPCVAGPAMMKSAAGSPGPTIFGRMPV